MPYELLVRLGSMQLPSGIEDQGDIEKLSVLAVIELVDAIIPKRGVAHPYLYQSPAVVLRLTARGIAVLAKRGT